MQKTTLINMTQAEKEAALSIISNGLSKIINNYTDNALLINSCHVAIDRYSHFKTTLSTTLNIPEPLRLENEIEVQFNSENLVTKYGSDVQQIIFENYIITSVTIVDAILEDLYEYFLRASNPNLTEVQIERAVRDAWTNQNLINFLSDPHGINLQKPANKDTEFGEAFIRYTELRIVRHTLLHTNGKLSHKNKQKLHDNLNATPNERKQFALGGSPLFNANDEVVLNVNHMLSIRQYLVRYLMYLYSSINERII